jgi:VCBS repeat protein
MFAFVRSLPLSVLLLMFSSMLALGQLTFTETLIPSGDASSHGIVAADFNSDGILDLLTVNSGSLSFYRGMPGAKYTAAVKQTLAGGGDQVVAADFSRHGTPDLAIIPIASGTHITILIGNNNGTFKQGTNISIGGVPQSMTLADFTGNHVPDIAVSACPSSGTSPCFAKVFRGLGDGTFALTATLQDGGGQIVAGDFNADGHQDIAVVAGNVIALYLGNGNGTFKSAVLANLSNVISIAVGDFYNNRVQSLAALGGTFLGGGNFETHLDTLRFSNGRLLVENHRVLQAETGIPYNRIAAGDLSGNYIDDILLVGFDVHGQLADFALGNGNGTFSSIHHAPAGEEGLTSPFIRDLDGDSRHDAGLAWTDIFGNTGGADVLRNTNAATGCSLPPAHLAVHICTPLNGQVLSGSIRFTGSGNARQGIAKRMELRIDGKKVAQNLQDQLKAFITLTPGKHVATFTVVDSFDNHVSGSVSFTSQ